MNSPCMDQASKMENHKSNWTFIDSSHNFGGPEVRVIQMRDLNILGNIRYQNLWRMMTAGELGDYNFGTIPIVFSEIDIKVSPLCF